MKTFAVGYEEAGIQRVGLCGASRETLGTEHHEITVGMDQFFDRFRI